MNVSGQDINQALEYRYTTAIVRLLPTGLLLIFLGLVIFVLADLDRDPWAFVGIFLSWVVGVALVGLTLWRRANHGKPLFTFAPDGIRYRIPLVKEVLIPWHEIQGVDTIDIEAGYWSLFWLTQTPSLQYHTTVVHNVTVVLLPKPFYDARIFVEPPSFNAPIEDAAEGGDVAVVDGLDTDLLSEAVVSPANDVLLGYSVGGIMFEERD